MKDFLTLASGALLLGLCAAATPARAQTADAISLTQVSPASLRLRIATAAPLAGRVQVVRLDTGQPLFAASYEAAAYGHRFDFSRVPSGRYLVGIQAGDNAYRCIVRVRTQADASTVRVAKLTSRAMPAAVAIGQLANRPLAEPAIATVAAPVSPLAGAKQ